MSRTLLLLGVGILWAITMAALIRREFLPYLEYQEPPSYRSFLKDVEEPDLTVRDIFFGMEQLGRVETLTEPLDDGSFRIRSRTQMDLASLPNIRKMPGSDKTMKGFSESIITAEYQLDHFEMKARMLGIPTKVSGRREGKDLVGEYDMVFLKDKFRIKDFPEDMTLAADDRLPYLGGGHLRVGKRWQMKVLRPKMAVGGDNITVETAYAEVLGRETRYWKNEPVEVFRVEIKWKPDPQHERTPHYTLYINNNGKVLEQEMKFHGQTLRFILAEEKTLTADEAVEWNNQ